jgi:predicted NBD/HSP70 family sugar kinase
MNKSLNQKGLRRADPQSPRPLADAVLQLIWQERSLSRADIARQAELSRSTVSEIVGEILPMGLVSECGEGPSRGGRRPILLEFKDDACVILGVEMGASHVEVVLTDLRGRVLDSRVRDHPVRTDPPGTRALIAELCTMCMAGRPEPLVGIGVAVPCPVDLTDSHRLSEVVMPAWNGELGLEPLEEQFGVPVIVDNDANLGALAEYWWGVGQGVEDLAYIKVATGIGSGHVVGGEIYRGASGFAGEIGHIAIDPRGRRCVCGLNGCLVTLVGGRALVERANEIRDAHPGSTLAGGVETISQIEDAALDGDPLGLAVAHEAANNLGIAISGMLNLLNPSMVVIGGDLARLGDLLLTPLRETVAIRTLVSSVAAAEIRTSTLGLQSIAIGASTLVLKSALADSRLFPRVEAPAPSRP